MTDDQAKIRFAKYKKISNLQPEKTVKKIAKQRKSEFLLGFFFAITQTTIKIVKNGFLPNYCSDLGRFFDV